MIRHHPDDALLLAHAAATLAPAQALLVATHLEGCARCRQGLRAFEGLGGEALETSPAAPLPTQMLESTLARLERPAAPAVAPPVLPRPALPAGLDWPRSLRHARISGWRLLGPGMRWARVTLPYAPRANLYLLRIGAGKCLPPHTHTDGELTQVLYGSFDDGRAVFGPGDFDATDSSIHHQPVVQASGECLCLAAVDGRLAFDSRIARWMGRLIGM